MYKYFQFIFCFSRINMSNQLLNRIPLVLRKSSNRTQMPTFSITSNSRITASRCLQTKSNNYKTEKNQSYTLSDLTQDEVKHHSKLAFDWWDPKGALRALHSLNKLSRINMSNQLLNRIPLVLRKSSNRTQMPTFSITSNSRITASRCLQTKSNNYKTEKNQSYTLSDLTQDEVKHHSKLAFDWWDPKGALRALHSLNKLRVPFICAGLEAEGKIFSELVNTPNVLRNQKILEVGCGGGILTENLAHLGANVTALDLSEDLIEVARQHLALNPNQELVERIQYKIEPVELHAMEKKNVYDAVVLSEVLEHVDDKVSFLTACVKALKPGGIVFISTLNKTIPMWVVGVLIGEYMLQAIPIGTHHYSKMISPLDVKEILNTLNCDTKLVKGSSYNFLRNYWRWINTTCTFYAMYAVKRDV